MRSHSSTWRQKPSEAEIDWAGDNFLMAANSAVTQYFFLLHGINSSTSRLLAAKQWSFICQKEH